MNLKPVQQVVERAFRRTMLEIEGDVIIEIEKLDIQVTGDLKKDVNSEVTASGWDIRGSIGNALHYAPYVHEGTKPHWAPIDPLRVWVKMKTGLRGEDVDRTARRVQAAIAAKGTRPRPYLRNVMERWQAKFEQVLGRKIAEGVR